MSGLNTSESHHVYNNNSKELDKIVDNNSTSLTHSDVIETEKVLTGETNLINQEQYQDFDKSIKHENTQFDTVNLNTNIENQEFSGCDDKTEIISTNNNINNNINQIQTDESQIQSSNVNNPNNLNFNNLSSDSYPNPTLNTNPSIVDSPHPSNAHHNIPPEQ